MPFAGRGKEERSAEGLYSLGADHRISEFVGIMLCDHPHARRLL